MNRRFVGFAGAVLAFGVFVAAASQQRVVVFRDIAYGADAQQRLDVFVPQDGRRAHPVIILIHGGGFTGGDKRSMEIPAERFADAHYVAVNVDYRLARAAAPGYPAQVEDMHSVVRWIARNASPYGMDRRRIGALGSSAGAYLAAMMAAHGETRASVLWSAPTNLVELVPLQGAQRVISTYMSCEPERCARAYRDASPLDAVDARSGPMLIFNSQDELIPRSQADELHQRLDAARVENLLVIFKGRRHAVAYAQDAWDPTLAFLNEHLRP